MYFTLFFSEQKPNKGRELLELPQLEQKPNNSLLATTHTAYRVPAVLTVEVVAISTSTGEVQAVRNVIIVPTTRPPEAEAAHAVLGAGVEVAGSSEHTRVSSAIPKVSWSNI